MSNKVISWLEETEEVFLDDSDDTDADPSYVDPAELRENESDSDISEPTPSIITQRSNTSQTSRKDKQTKWYKDAPPKNVRTRQRNFVLRLPGVKPTGRNANSILKCWNLFFADSMIDDIVKYTNIYLDKIRSKYTQKHMVRETSKSEINALFGLLYLAGVQRGNHLNLDDLWSNDGLSPEYFRAVMPKARFYILLRAMRFDDIGTRAQRKQFDKLAAIRSIFDEFVLRCENYYTVGANVTIDEMLESFRGRCSFRVYIPSKPNKYGIKIQALVDSSTFYTSKMEVYVGTQPDGPYKCENDPASVVKRLIAPITKTGRNITMDNWYNSIPLAIDLLKNHNTTVVGTLRKNKREIPLCFLDTKKRQLNSTMFDYDKDILLTSYVPKKNKNVLLISTMHEQGVIDPESEKRKPEVITYYNSTKSGVDCVDEMKGEYSVARISCRWPLTIFFSLMNIGGINSQIIFRENTGIYLSRRKFLKTLGKELTRPFMLERLQMPTLRTSTRQRIIKLTGYTKTEDEVPERSNIDHRPKCVFCPKRKNRKTMTKCVKCSVPICKEHTTSTCVSCCNDHNEISSTESE
ncbi:piggyBac transposable element-derived protein 4-like [Daktulosphaira vitifoliae]|uniref:piggyBac transposable element-derived protein 4-like n=1 Tax=Daktulosphaira vitifoliae TaxID=58002 RepID=UPI0021AAD871|nr:piggyBac transposable element-derived protein 4-like [Daktulosphaira vitifoliae]